MRKLEGINESLLFRNPLFRNESIGQRKLKPCNVLTGIRNLYYSNESKARIYTSRENVPKVSIYSSFKSVSIRHRQLKT
jgi:hypothetical protein